MGPSTAASPPTRGQTRGVPRHAARRPEQGAFPMTRPTSVLALAVATVRAGKQTVVDLRQGSKDASSSQIIYVPTPQKVVDRMLELAKLTKDDVVFDLGCGDGRVVVSAARKYGARGVGIDIDPQR